MEPLFLLALALTATVAVGNSPHRPMTIYGEYVCNILLMQTLIFHSSVSLIF